TTTAWSAPGGDRACAARRRRSPAHRRTRAHAAARPRAARPGRHPPRRFVPPPSPGALLHDYGLHGTHPGRHLGGFVLLDGGMRVELQPPVLGDAKHLVGLQLTDSVPVTAPVIDTHPKFG